MNLAHNEFLREKINERIKEVFGKQSALIKDAEERGMILSKSRLSKYLTGQSGGIVEDQILWVATRLGIFVNIGFGEPVLKEGKLKYEISKYNEAECLRRLKKIFSGLKDPIVRDGKPTYEIVEKVKSNKKSKK